MTTEIVLLLAIFAFIVMGVFLGDLGPIATFRNSGPNLGAKIERQISIGHNFYENGQRIPDWGDDGSQ